MPRKFLIGLDAGGGGGRCLLVDVDSQAVVTARRAWSAQPVPDADGWAYDLNLDLVWQFMGEAVCEAMQAARAEPEQVAGIAVTSMRHSIIVLDQNKKAILATPNLDARAADASMELAAFRGEEFFRRTGHFPNPIFAACRLKWLAEHDPRSFDKAKMVISLNEWLAFRLCGELAADFSQAGETMLLDLHNGEWARDLLKSLYIPPSIFPKIHKAGSRLGGLTAEAASHLGIKPGIPVAVGGADTQCALLGSGAVRTGQLGIVAGTTSPLQMITSEPILDTQARLWTGRNVIAEQFIVESNAGSSGEVLDWMARLLYPDARKPAAMLDAEAAQSVPGAGGLISTLGGQIFNGSKMNLPFGYLVIPHAVGMKDDNNRRHLARAFLEGMACVIRANAGQISEVTGVSQPEYFLAGGVSRSRVWAQILANVFNQPIHAARYPEASGMGAAICAGVGAGVFGGLVEGSQVLTGKPDLIEPNAGDVEIYQEIYANWQELRRAQADSDELAAGILLKGITSSHAKTVTRREPAFKPCILVTAQMDEISLNRLRRMGEVTYQNYRETYNVLTGSDLVEAMQGKHVLITEVDVVDADALSKLPDLRLIVSCRGNAVNIDAAACTAFGIPLLNTPGRNADAVADLTVALMLMLARKLVPAAQFLHDPEGEAGDLARMGSAYSQFQGAELWRKTVGLVGLGAIGRGVTHRSLSFGARVLVYDPYLTPAQAILAGAEWVSLEELLRCSDFVSLHAPSNAETAGMLGEKELGLMKPGAFLINTARAALVDENALVEALNSGHLGGAAVDVFAVEPPGPHDRLLTAHNVIATPHLGGNTFDVAAHQGEIAADELERILKGERPRFILNPHTFDDFSWTGPKPVVSDEVIRRLSSGSGPAVSDLDTKPESPVPGRTPAMKPEVEAQPPKEKGGLFSSLRSLVSGKQVAAPTAATTPVIDLPAPTEKGNQTAMLEKIIQSFLAACEKDAALLSFAANRVFKMSYTLNDAALEFFMVFENGTVKASMGVLAGKPDLSLKMKADIFDGMMTGRINATSAAMSGKMKFSGDTSKAM